MGIKKGLSTVNEYMIDIISSYLKEVSVSNYFIVLMDPSHMKRWGLANLQVTSGEAVMACKL